MAELTIGKAKITLKSRGCIDCGGEHSTGWHVARVLKVTIEGFKQREVIVGICDECKASREKKLLSKTKRHGTIH